jgi:hypothetical protein
MKLKFIFIRDILYMMIQTYIFLLPPFTTFFLLLKSPFAFGNNHLNDVKNLLRLEITT